MNGKSIATLVLLAFVAVSVGYLVVSESRTHPTANNPARASTPVAGDAAPAATAPQHQVVAYYFHNTQRCETCLKIEQLSEAALREQFAAAFDSGALEWRTVNMEEPPNEHFVHDYQLVASSLVFVDLRDGAQRDWINMEEVWQLIHDDEAEFKRYVADQARKYLES